MANNITLAKNYSALLDEVYQNASVTADLTGDASMARAGVNVNEICYPQISVGGLGDYDRNSGYTDVPYLWNGKPSLSIMTAVRKSASTQWTIRKPSTSHLEKQERS